MKFKIALMFGLALSLIYFQWSAAVALLMGVVFALSIGNPIATKTRLWAQKLLMISVIGLGAGMNLLVVGLVGLHGVGYTAMTIVGTMIVGLLLGRFLRTLPDTSLLVSVGTAICGGSAIAAVAAAIKARHEEISVSLAIVFILNALALFIFPALGHQLGFSQTQFGLWAALAVHDTSSVIGTAMQYGSEALQTGTTVKLARALWIIPMTLIIGLQRQSRARVKIPWFILGFVIVAAIVTIFPSLQPFGSRVAGISRIMLVLTLFLIGCNLTRDTIKSVGVRPFVQGILLWLIVSVSTAFLIKEGWLG